MDKIDVLKKLNLSPAEAKAYLAVLDAGKLKVSEIGRLCGVTRMAGYTAVELLIKKGLLSYADERGQKYAIAEDPERLVLRAKDAKNKLEEEENELKELLPELRVLYQTADIKPKVKVYSGVEGLKSVGEDLLSTLKAGESYVGYGSVREEFEDLEFYFEDFVPRRIKKNISFRGIVPGELNEYKAEENKVKLREFRVVPVKEFPFKNEINIYSNKISIMSFKDQIGLVIESKQISDTQRLIFELAWLGAKQ